MLCLSIEIKVTPSNHPPVSWGLSCLLLLFLLLCQGHIGLCAQAGEQNCVENYRSGCAIHLKNFTCPRIVVSADGTDFTSTHRASKGMDRNSVTYLAAWQYTARVNEVFLKGPLLGNGVISSYKTRTLFSLPQCFLASLQYKYSVLHCEHYIKLLRSNHKLCIVDGYISLPGGSCLPTPALPCFFPNAHIPLCLLPAMLQWDT